MECFCLVGKQQPLLQLIEDYLSNLSLFFVAVLASRFKLRLRDLPENRAARIAALTISSTAALIISIYLVMASGFGA